jgi:hypothetical protein
MPKSKRTTKPSPTPTLDQLDALDEHLVEANRQTMPPIVGGDPIRERNAERPTIPDAVIKALATEMAQSQGIRRPTAAQLHFTLPLSYSRIAELVLVGIRYAQEEGSDVE